MTVKTAITTLPDVAALNADRRVADKTARGDERETERVRRTLWLELLSATCEEERAVLRCAINLLKGAQAFEIDPVTGLSCTVAGFERAAASWAEHLYWYDRKDAADTNGYRHDFAMEGRQVQVRYAAVHPELAEPVWFPDHGPHSCVFCLMGSNEAVGLPVETGMDPVTGGVLPGLEDVL